MSTELTRGGNGGLVPQGAGDLWKLAEAAVKGGITKPDVTPERAFAIMAYAMELGVSPLQGLFGIYFPQGAGTPTCSEKLMRSLVQSTGEVEDLQENIQGDGKARTATCVLKRKGIPTPTTAKYSMADAERAKLLGKDNWQKYPDRMLKARAFSFAANDAFQDVLKGLYERSEIEDSFSEKPPAETPPHVVKESRPLLKKAPPATAEEAKARVVEILAEAPASAPEPAPEKTMEELSREVDADEEKRKQIAAMVFFRGFGLSDERIFAKLGIGGIEDLDEPRRDVLKLIAKEAAKLTKEKADWRGYLNQEFPEPAF